MRKNRRALPRRALSQILEPVQDDFDTVATQRTTTLASYAAEILSVNAAKANTLESQVTSGDSFRVALENQIATISAVNLDEELANIIVLQNAYAASAKMTSAISQMLDTLLKIV